MHGGPTGIIPTYNFLNIFYCQKTTSELREYELLDNSSNENVVLFSFHKKPVFFVILPCKIKRMLTVGNVIYVNRLSPTSNYEK